MKNISIWKDTVKKEKFDKLNSDIDTDVLIIGGGITGVSTMYHLCNSGLKVVLVEQNKIGYGVTGNSTGKLTYLQNDLIDKIRKCFDDDTALKYIKSQIEGINLIRGIIKKEKINCDFVKVPSYIYTNKEDEIAVLKNMEEFLSNNNINTIHSDINIVDNKYNFGVNDSYMFHPLKFLYGIINNLNCNVYEDTSIKKIEFNDDVYICYTNTNKINAKWVVIASHYPYFNLPFVFPIKCSLEKSYLSVSKYKVNNISLISYSNPFISIRNYKDYLIYLSNSHDINTDINDNLHFDELKKKINDLGLVNNYLWSNIDIITNDGLPYIGRLKDNMLIGTGYNTWGLANGVLAGKILADIIIGDNNEYINLFNPNRLNMSQVTGYFVNSIKNLQGYFNGIIKKDNYIVYKKVNGIKVMEYNDNRKKYVVRRKCPHLGCNLVFNKVEKTWDCPCHGSRFDIVGKCISGPANEDIGYNNN